MKSDYTVCKLNLLEKKARNSGMQRNEKCASMRSSNVAASQGKYLLNLFLTDIIITFGLYCNAPARCANWISLLSAKSAIGAPVSRFACGDTSAPKIKLHHTNQKVFQK
jgi:hypothetical protein